LVYMRGILGIHLGNHYGAILLLLFVATSCGNMLGICIGCISRIGMGAKAGILTGLGLLLSMLSDLMVSGIRDKIEHTIPILNDINPAALIVDSFYALNVYDTYERFAGNLIMLLIITTILAVVSILLVRRNRYASL
ncbi:MAG: ABC transporter permease, partial [Eubacterium sp.]|nr:ABC transporter permease [Eubacterium sp.]